MRINRRGQTIATDQLGSTILMGIVIFIVFLGLGYLAYLFATGRLSIFGGT